MNITGYTELEQRAIDSLRYIKEHKDAKSVLTEVSSFKERILRLGFIESEIVNSSKINDSTFTYLFALGIKTKVVHIYKKSNPISDEIWKSESTDTVVIPLAEVEEYMNNCLAKLEKKGYALSKIKLVDFEKRNQNLYAAFEINNEKQRLLDDIVIKGEVKFPESHRKQLIKKYRKRIFNQDNLKNLHGDIEKIRFVKQLRYPEILFKTDSTKIYCYLEKSKSNTFDGFIGFTNSETQNVTVNGYIDVVLNNLLNTGETFAVNWRSNGNDQRTFNARIELPYIFNSAFALKAHLNIFRQDSTFQNTETALDLGYLISYNSRFYIGYQSSESSDIQNQNRFTLSDYKNSFITGQFLFANFRSDEFLFPEKTKIDIKTGIGSRRSKFNSNDQIFINANLKHVFFLNEKNNIQVVSHNFYLNSDQYIVNELFRFGGINSIRGFNENSLQASLFGSLLSEYRYVIAQNLYVHSIIDYGYFDDQTAKNEGALLGLGLGFGLATKNGLFNLVYANGSSGGQEIKGSNSIVHVSFKTQF